MHPNGQTNHPVRFPGAGNRPSAGGSDLGAFVAIGPNCGRTQARSARLTLEQFHQLLQSGDWSRVENELEHLHQDLPAEDNHWNYGNVYHQCMTLNGLLALYKDHDLARAKAFLALSAQTPTSPQLLSFGPNMLLAKSILEHGEFEAVDSYLAGCESFLARRRDNPSSMANPVARKSGS